MPTCYQLIGIPASGKTTWYNNQDWIKDIVYISTDKFVEEYAKIQGKTYSEVFKEYMPTAVNLMVNEVNAAADNNHDIVWDQTSTTIISRAKKFNMLPNYKHIAVVFGIPKPNELIRRLCNRPGKEIPNNVITSMIEKFEEPTLEEGFAEIWRA